MPVVPNAREVLLSLYEETLRKVSEYNEAEEYNAYVIQLVKYRQSIVQRSTDVATIEADVACGQIEELIEQAEDEYDLMIAMNETIRPWEDDPEGDEEFAEYHPPYGQEKSQFILEPTADEQKAFDTFNSGGGQQTDGGGGAAAGGAAGTGASAGSATGAGASAATGGTQQPAASATTAAKA